MDCPVGDFFANALSRIPYRSLAMGLTQEGYYCCFRMPFDRKAQISILNENLTDSIPFKKRILVTVEHGTENNMTNDYSGSAYWYSRPGGKDFLFMRPVEERPVVLPEEWPAFRDEVARHYGLELRRLPADVVASIKAHPTDAQRHGYRLMILARTTRHGEHLGLSAEEAAEFPRRWMELKKGGPKAEGAGTDRVLLELGERLSVTEAR